MAEIKEKRTHEENIEFLRNIKDIYKLTRACEYFNINQANLYNVVNKNTKTISPEKLDKMVEYILDDMQTHIDDAKK